MADELNKSAEFEGKHKDEEDPILVAQRYLNIFRQIHIFNKNRQEQFDNSLIELPSDIRILLSTLPGGSVLLDHITEIEEKRGLISMPSLDEEPSKKEKQKSSKKEEMKDSSVSQNNANGSINISNNILKVLKQNEEQHEKEMKALTDAFLKSQENMADILKEILDKQPAQVAPVFIQAPASSPEPVSKETPLTTKDFDLSKTDQTYKNTTETKSDSEEHSHSESTGIFSGIARRLFSGKNKESKENSEINKKNDTQFEDLLDQQEAVSLDDIKGEPVSLDDIKDEPVSLDDIKDEFTSLNDIEDKPDSLDNIKDESVSLDDFKDGFTSSDDLEKTSNIKDSSLTTEPENSSLDEELLSAFQNDETANSSPDETEADDDWEWEYVDESDNNSKQNNDNKEYGSESTDQTPQNDDEWEYVEEPQDGADQGDDEWEYVEEPADDTDQGDDEWEYVEEPQDGADQGDDEWEYVEEPVDDTDQGDEEWEYVEEPVEETDQNNDEWEYVEEPVDDSDEDKKK